MKTKVDILSSIKRLRDDLRLKRYSADSVDAEKSNEGTKDGISFDDALSSIGKLNNFKKNLS